VAVIGGGVMGASTAYQLVRAGIRDLMLLVAHELASGSSGKPLAFNYSRDLPLAQGVSFA
jgi:sarcosine oxidase subunit beta